MSTQKVTKESGVSESLIPYVQWVVGLLTAKYGMTDVNNLEVATEIVKFFSDEHRYLKFIERIDEKTLNEFKDVLANDKLN